MIKFFRKIRQQMLFEGKPALPAGRFSKYILYAIGEIFLVVIGILIALQINTRNHARLAKIEEVKVLTEIRNVLDTDIEILKGKIDDYSFVEFRIQKLLIILEDGVVKAEDSLDMLFGSAYGIAWFHLKITPFEVLKSKGLELVSNDLIRSQLIELYEVRNQHIEFYFDFESNSVVELYRPYYMENFSNLKILESATPINIDKVLNDTYYYNIVSYRLSGLHNFLIVLKTALPEMEHLKELLDEFIDNKE